MMRQFKKLLLVASGIALLAGGAAAQYRDPRVNLVGRVLFDLDRARSYGRVDHHERDHFDKARRDLLVFQDHYARGRFDKDRLDGAIDNIHHLVDADQVHPRDRQVLRRDMEALRDFRAARDGYGYRGYRY